MKLIVITTAKTFEFAVPITRSINDVNLEIVNEVMNNKLPYVMFDYPPYYAQKFIAKHPIPIHKQHLISWCITEE